MCHFAVSENQSVTPPGDVGKGEGCLLAAHGLQNQLK